MLKIREEIHITVRSLIHRFIIKDFEVLDIYNFNPTIRYNPYLIQRLNKL